MPRDVIDKLTAAADAAAQMLTESEADGDCARKILDDLQAADSTAVRALPPDNSVREVRRYRDPEGRERVVLEVDLDDDLVAFLDTLPDPDAVIEEALRRIANTSALGRHAYHQRIRAAAGEFGLSVGWGADLDMWMEHYPDPPRRLTPQVLADHAAWRSRRPSLRVAERKGALVTGTSGSVANRGAGDPRAAGTTTHDYRTRGSRSTRTGEDDDRGDE